MQCILLVSLCPVTISHTAIEHLQILNVCCRFETCQFFMDFHFQILSSGHFHSSVALPNHAHLTFTFTFTFGMDYVQRSDTAVHQLRASAQPPHNQRLDESISSSYELERMHNLHKIIIWSNQRSFWPNT